MPSQSAWRNSPIRYEAARLLGRRHAPPTTLVVHLRRLYWIFVRRYAYEICNHCGRPVGRSTGSYWLADDALWESINGRSEGVMCPPCFTAAGQQSGLWIAWKAVVDAR